MNVNAHDGHVKRTESAFCAIWSFFYGFFLMSDSLADGLVRMETLLKATSQVSDYWTKSRTLPIVFRTAMLYFWSQVYA